MDPRLSVCQQRGFGECRLQDRGGCTTCTMDGMCMSVCIFVYMQITCSRGCSCLSDVATGCMPCLYYTQVPCSTDCFQPTEEGATQRTDILCNATSMVRRSHEFDLVQAFQLLLRICPCSGMPRQQQLARCLWRLYEPARFSPEAPERFYATEAGWHSILLGTGVGRDSVVVVLHHSVSHWFQRQMVFILVVTVHWCTAVNRYHKPHLPFRFPVSFGDYDNIW